MTVEVESQKTYTDFVVQNHPVKTNDEPLIKTLRVDLY